MFGLLDRIFDWLGIPCTVCRCLLLFNIITGIILLLCVMRVAERRDHYRQRLWDINDGGYSHGFKIPEEPTKE